MISGAAILLAELLLLFVAVTAFVQLTQRRLGVDRLRRFLGGPAPVAAAKGIAVGVVTPFCTYSAIPMLVGLQRARVPTAAWAAFILAAPVLDPVLFGALGLIAGLDVALTYLAVTVMAAGLLALIAQRTRVERHLRADAVADIACDAGTEPWRGWPSELRSAGAGSMALLRRFAPILVVGVAIGTGIEHWIPTRVIAGITDLGGAAIPVAAGLGTPLYVNTELLVPVAASLHGAGVGIGAVVALTIAGAGANIPEFVVLGRLAQTKVVAFFIAYVFIVATVGGVIAALVAG